MLTVAILACKGDERGTPPVTLPVAPLTARPTAPPTSPPPAHDAGADIRVYTASDFLAAWEKTQPADLVRSFPPSPPFYRISGALVSVETPVLRDSQGRPDPTRKASSDAFVRAGPGKKVALRFAPDSADLPKVKGSKVGTTLTATCAFSGLAEMGIVTFDDCKF